MTTSTTRPRTTTTELAPEVHSYKTSSGEYNLFKRCMSCGIGQWLHFLTDQRFANKAYWFQCVKCGERTDCNGHTRYTRSVVCS